MIGFKKYYGSLRESETPIPTSYEKMVLDNIEKLYTPLRSQLVKRTVFQSILDQSTIAKFYAFFNGRAKRPVIRDPEPGLVETVEKLEAMKNVVKNDNAPRVWLAYNYMLFLQNILLIQHMRFEHENYTRGNDDMLRYVMDSDMPATVDKPSAMEWFERNYDGNSKVRITTGAWTAMDLYRLLHNVDDRINLIEFPKG